MRYSHSFCFILNKRLPLPSSLMGGREGWFIDWPPYWKQRSGNISLSPLNRHLKYLPTTHPRDAHTRQVSSRINLFRWSLHAAILAYLFFPLGPFDAINPFHVSHFVRDCSAELKLVLWGQSNSLQGCLTKQFGTVFLVCSFSML